ncbi:MAG: hypothetical protein V3T81_02860 [Thermoanaerobaculia bacterium]
MTNRAAYISLIIALVTSLADRPVAAARGDCRGLQPTSWQREIAGADEPGERVVVEGRVLDGDGMTPLAGITVFVFHTDARGHYSGEGMDESNARLCGLVRTDAMGRYRFETIRPAPYATGRVAAHIHYQVWGPGVRRQSFLLQFEGDPLLGERGRDASGNPVWARIRPLTLDADGVFHVERDLHVSWL